LCGATPVLGQFLILVDKEMFILEVKLSLLEGVWSGVLIYILGVSCSGIFFHFHCGFLDKQKMLG
jgi:hypothetical protein